MRKMKDSGIEWIGEIPEEWEIVKTLYVLIMPITDGPHTTPELFDEGIPFVSAEAVSCGNGQIDFNHIRGYISKEFYDECCKKYIPKINDIYMIKSGATTGKVALVNTNRVFTIWSPLAVFRCDEQKMNYKYLYYTLQADYYLKQIETKWSFGTQQNIGMRVLEQLRICFPSMPEQQKISAFLDRKCSEIDSVIEKTKTTIEEYKALKQSVITQAVTKGIRKGRKMKDSGIEWIGEIPEEWEIRKLFRAIEQIGDIDHYMPESVDKGVPYLMTGDLSENISDIELNNCKQISDNDYKTLSEKITISKGDVIFARYATIGTVCYVDVDTPFLVSYSCLTIKPMKKCLNGKYLFYYLKSDTFFEDIKQYIKSNTQSNVGLDSMGKAKIILPSLNEQQEIANHLDEKCDAIDTLIDKKEQLLTELESYKKSVIYEYVTGKKEV